MGVKSPENFTSTSRSSVTQDILNMGHVCFCWHIPALNNAVLQALIICRLAQKRSYSEIRISPGNEFFSTKECSTLFLDFPSLVYIIDVLWTVSCEASLVKPLGSHGSFSWFVGTQQRAPLPDFAFRAIRVIRGLLWPAPATSSSSPTFGAKLK